jgi:vacuolar-type H+-ATPase subunit H
MKLEGQVQKFKEVESMLHQTLAQAQQSTMSVVENAKREAELIRQEAQMKAAQILERAKNDAIALHDDIERLNAQKHEIVSKLRLLLSSQLDLLNSFSASEDSYIVNQIAARKQLRVASSTGFRIPTTRQPPTHQPAPYLNSTLHLNSAPRILLSHASCFRCHHALYDRRFHSCTQCVSDLLKKKPVRYEVPVDTYKGSLDKGTLSARKVNIDEILNSLE